MGLQVSELLLQVLTVCTNTVVERQSWADSKRVHTFQHSAFHVQAETSVPSVVLDHVSQLNDELSLFVFLTALKGMLIFPTQRGFTVFTVDVSDSMKTCEENPLLSWPTAHVHHCIEEIGSSLAALK